MNDFLSGYKTYDPDREGFGNKDNWRHSFFERLSPEDAKKILDDDSPWGILGIRRSATMEDILKAFRSKAMEWHPDRNPHRIEEATEMMKKINAAYSILL